MGKAPRGARGAAAARKGVGKSAKELADKEVFAKKPSRARRGAPNKRVETSVGNAFRLVGGSDDDEEAQASEDEMGEEEVEELMPLKGMSDEEEEEDDDDDDDDEEDDDEDEQLKGLHDREVSSGLAAALQMARTRNMLGEEKEAAGRMFDSKGAGLHNYEEGSEAEKGVQLNYFDEYGRKMTQKEAFRQLSWKFHGKGPSKKRKEKRMAAFEAQMTEQKDDRAMAYMGVLQRAQQSTKSAHVVLTGQHAIKASEVTAKQRKADKPAPKKPKLG